MSKTRLPKSTRKSVRPVGPLVLPTLPPSEPMVREIEKDDGLVEDVQYSGNYEEAAEGFRLSVVPPSEHSQVHDNDDLAEIVASLDSAGGSSASLYDETKPPKPVRKDSRVKLRFGKEMASLPTGLTAEQMTQSVIHGATPVLAEYIEDEPQQPFLDELPAADLDQTDEKTEPHGYPSLSPMLPPVDSLVAQAADAQPDGASYLEDDSSPVALLNIPDPRVEPAAEPNPHSDTLNTMFGPPNAKEFSMPVPLTPPPSNSKGWQIVAVVAAFAIVAAVAIGAKHRDDLSAAWQTKFESTPDVTVVTQEPEAEPTVSPEGLGPVSTPTTQPDAVAKVEPPTALVPPVAAPIVVPPPTIAKVEPPAAKKPESPPAVVAKAKPVETTPTAPAAKPAAPVAKPTVAAVVTPRTPPTTVTHVLVSGVGKKPMCKADCTWGNLNAEGLPVAVGGRKTVVCGDVTYTAVVTASTEKKYCWDASSLQPVEPPSDPDGP